MANLEFCLTGVVAMSLKEDYKSKNGYLEFAPNQLNFVIELSWHAWAFPGLRSETAD